MHEILLHEAARRHRRRADAHTARRERRGVTENCILVQRDVQQVAQIFHLTPSQAERAQIPEHQVVVGATRDEVVTFAHQSFAERLGVRLRLDLVRLELGRLHVLQSHRESADLVVVRTTLQRRKHRHVDARLVVVRLARLGVETTAEENHTRTRTAKGLVRSRCDDVAVRERLRLLLRGNQTRDVRHIHHQHRPALIGDFSKSHVIPITRVRRATANDHLRSEIKCLFFQLVVINVTRRRIHLVRQRLEENRRRGNLLPIRGVISVRQMTSRR